MLTRQAVKVLIFGVGDLSLGHSFWSKSADNANLLAKHSIGFN